MKSVIVGTAGHVDHGKTALVKALTGIDADRLEEEKRRGITIDIGFAHVELPAPSGDRLRLGFVDVPGHERFVRNMLAGIGGIDLVLLVVAADEWIKPQTREHFDICRLLNIRSGLVVITKSDLVDQDTLDVVRLEVEEFVRGSFLEGAPITPVSAITGAGLEELKRQLVRIASEVPAKNVTAAFRLPVDRVFTMKGFGTVVTGTLLSGRIRKEDEVEIYPTGRRARVRGIQVHGASAEGALAGQRTALNLSGVDVPDLTRGMVLGPAGMFRAGTRLDVSLSLLADAQPLKDHARVHLHAHTAEAVAEVALYMPERDGNGQPGITRARLAPGESGFAQLRLAEPVLLLPGDKFIIRQFSPVITIGGGTVVDVAGLRRKQRDPKVLGELQALSTAGPEEAIAIRVRRRGSRGLSQAAAVAETGWPPAEVERVAKALVTSGKALAVNGTLVASDAIATARAETLAALNAFHDANPLIPGMSKEELRGTLGLAPEIFSAVLDSLVRERKVVVNGEQASITGRGVQMKDEEARSKDEIEQAFCSAGLKVPALKNVLAGLKVDRVRAQKIVTLLLRDRVLIKISDDLVFHRTALEELKRGVAALKTTAPRIDVSRFKDMTGVSRKYAIPLLEWLDRERVTRRVGDAREIL